MMYLGEPLVDGYGLAVWCENWEHLIIGTQPDNVRDYQARRGREGGPLADQRGARGRAVAIRAAILAARGAGTSVEKALQQAINAGIREILRHAQPAALSCIAVTPRARPPGPGKVMELHLIGGIGAALPPPGLGIVGRLT